MKVSNRPAGRMDSKPVMDVSGWEAFVHGVFAIAVTLLVLDIHVPDAGSVDSGSALLQALASQMPHYAAYAIGFLCLGTYWINVHRSLRMLRGIDHGFIVIGLMFLMVISAVPFVTALLAEYIGAGNGRDQVALVIFTSWQLLLSILAVASVGYAYRERRRLFRPGVADAGGRTWVRLSVLGPLIWFVALVTALLANGTITLILIAVVFVTFLFEVPVREETSDAST